MNNNSEQQDMFSSTVSGTPPAPPEPELIVSLKIPGRLPSWNDILGMEFWARDKFKSQLQDDFLSALQQCATDCSTKTTPAKNIILTACDTLACYRETVRQRRKSRRYKKKQSQEAKSLFESKSSELPKPPF